MEEQEHQLKILPQYFDRVKRGIKTFEVRYNDKDFQSGDKVSLNEWDMRKSKCSGNQIDIKITYVFKDSLDGIDTGYCVFGFIKQ
ncbi:DUF3850 domain-containing protein [Tenacibaculum sp. nBUS_03]|uniref:DUF3850 domain-containing protein n=1 Tax=Tenacibaculum sp. nBUS_03 TaxID=3395320 RepID=UPI003EC0ADC1